ncbi:unnamed protein product [Rotaria sp. Silwood2]|nr:unnamed protein product [Rotaria sp. Silwood2]
MSSPLGHSSNLPEQQKAAYTVYENISPTTTSNYPIRTTNQEVSKEHQIAYGSVPVLYQPYGQPQSYLCVQPTPNNQIVNQYSPNNMVNQHQLYQQQVSSTSNVPPAFLHQAMLHSNTNPQQTLVSSYHPAVNTNVLFSSAMTNPTVASTPISATTKRGRNDTSGVSDSNVQERPQHYQTTRIFNARSTPNKRHRGTNQQQMENSYPYRYEQNSGEQLSYNITDRRNGVDPHANQHQPSLAACRYATSRFPFSPFSIIFSHEVREKVVIDDLIKHASENFHFELKTVAYRRGRSEDNEHRILVFVENSESFSFLFERGNWPTTLAGYEFATKRPSIPPQLSLVLPAVSLQIDWEDFVQEVKEKYPGVADIIRLKNKAQQSVRAVKLEFLSAKVRNDILEAKEIAVMHLKLNVVEFFSQANVLICSNCYGIGHFRKNCTQKNESTCKTCGDKCPNLKDHQCSGIPKCIHCAGSHISNDSKCKVVKDYRVALTRNLLAKLGQANNGYENLQTNANKIPAVGSTLGTSYAAIVKGMPSNSNDILLKKLDNIIVKVEEESNATRRSFEELKQEMKNHYEETKQRVEILDNQVKTMEKKLEDVTVKVYTILENVLLGEVGHVDFSLLGGAFANYRTFYQAGENAHGGVLVLIHNDIPATRISCSLPNVCVIDLLVEQTTRLVAIYAPASKSWDWTDLSSFRTNRCVITGDFNIDIEKDGEKAERLLEWMDACSLGPIIPDSNTSLRSDRTIDYALATGVNLSIQTCEDDTCSDHKPLVVVLACDTTLKLEGSRTVWQVFSLMLSYTFEFWESEWNVESNDITYERFIDFIVSLKARCTKYFPIMRARPSVPPEIMKLLAQSRSLSFKAKRKGDIVLRQEARRLRNIARFELKRYQQSQLTHQLKKRNSAGDESTVFWSKTKRHFQASSSSLRGFLLPGGEIIKDPQAMVDTAATYYETLFEAPVVVRPHPYVDAPIVEDVNRSEPISIVTYPEVLNVLRSRKKKQSLDIHGLSPFLLDKIPKNYWHIFIKLYNDSFANGYILKKFKEVRMILLAKKNAICAPDQTRPISLLDSFLKVQERLFLNRFLRLLKDRGILPDNQSGFRAEYRLQTRVLLLVEQISSYMSNSVPVATVFVDFKSAFDQLWFEGCLGKLTRMGIPSAYVKWIQSWLNYRQATIEIEGKRSKWIKINRGGPQGSSLTPTLFITYHSDMADFIPGAMSFFFADDLAAVLAGQIGLKFTDQCLDLERRLQTFFKQLEFYSVLAVQPINYSKTQTMFSARAVCYPNPMPEVRCGDNAIEWVSSFKYLGYWLTTKLGWGNVIA